MSDKSLLTGVNLKMVQTQIKQETGEAGAGYSDKPTVLGPDLGLTDLPKVLPINLNCNWIEKLLRVQDAQHGYLQTFPQTSQEHWEADG